MRGDSERERLFNRRSVLIGMGQVGLFSLLAGRLYYLQVIEGAKYRTLAEENRINLRLIAPPRGHIVDRAGIPLAINEQNYRVVLLPEQVENLEELINKIDKYVPLDTNARKRVWHDFRNDRNFNAVLVRDNLSWEQVAQLSLHTLDLPGADIDMGEVRSYPYGEVTSHILGYVGIVATDEMDANDDTDGDEEEENILTIPGFRIGKSGIEKQYDLILRGDAGDEQLEVNAHGRVIRELAHNDPKPGADSALTIDIGLQEFVYRRVAQEEGAAVVVVDIFSGGIYALVSQPGFDPNLFTYGISHDDWQRLNDDEHSPLLNKAISGLYSPGSTFKPILSMAGFESGILDPSATVFCPGYLDFGNYRFHCWKHGGHGHVNFEQAMAGSCDTYFYDLGHRVGIDRMQAMAQRFGLGQKLNIDLPHERAGVMPGRTWKQATQGHPWQLGETLVAAIGQGYTLLTPLQLAIMAARLANGGRSVDPYLLKAMATKNTPSSSLGFKSEHVEAVINAMSGVVNKAEGTAYAARILDPSMAMAGKTGTAQVRHISVSEREEGVTANDKLPWKERDHALFAGFAPLSSPRYAVGIVVEHGGSGAHVAAPIARDVLLECQRRKLS